MILLTPCGVKGFSYVCELVIKSVCAVKSCTGGKGGGTEGRGGGGQEAQTFIKL